jgi:hypothetical protein
MLQYVTEVILPQTTPDRPALVFTHGLAIKCLLRGILGSSPAMSRRFLLDNTAVTELGYQPEGAEQGWHILRINDTQHLNAAAPLAAAGLVAGATAAAAAAEAAAKAAAAAVQGEQQEEELH